MINNYQRDAGQEDDRDSGSLSLITPLDEGDQVSLPKKLDRFDGKTFCVKVILLFVICR